MTVWVSSNYVNGWINGAIVYPFAGADWNFWVFIGLLLIGFYCGLIGVPYTEDIGTGPSFRLTYQKTQHALSVAIGASLTFNGVTSDPSETVTHDILDASTVRFDSASCVGKKRRRRRQAQNPDQYV